MAVKENDLLDKDSPIGKLVTLALHQLKGNEDLRHEFIVCDAKPVPAMMIAKKITATHKAMLTEATESKKFLHIGQCFFKDGHVVFELETPSSGLVTRIKTALHQHTGKKHAVRVGDESSEGESAPGAVPRDIATAGKAVAAAAITAAKPVPEMLKAPEVWKLTCNALLTDAKGLGKAVQAQCADEPADFTKEINGYIQKLESRIENFGAKLARSLAKANEAKDTAAQKSELTNAKAIVAQTIKEAKPLAAVIDENPFVKTNFTGQLTTGLTQVAQAISRGLAA
jgi:hypothetical protein